MQLKILNFYLILNSLAFSVSTHAAPASEICARWLVAQKSVSNAAQAATAFFNQPLREAGEFVLTESDVQAYYANNPLTAGSMALVDAPNPQDRYKLNTRSDFQLQNWSLNYPTIFNRQQRWHFDIGAFVAGHGGGSLNEAQKRFFAGLKFDMKKYIFERPYHFMTEWGGLNHPTVAELTPAQVGLVNARFAQPVGQIQNSAYFSTDFHAQVDRVSDSELTAGNSFELLADSQSFLTKLRLIQVAKSSIWVSSLVFADDQTTNRLAAAMIQRQQDGLDVRVIVERSIALIHPQVVRRLRRAGVKVIYADDFFKYNSVTIYHSKIILIDGEQGILGGQNMLDADLGSNGTDFKNRDVDVLVHGPVVSDMVLRFMEDWNHFVSTKSWFSHNSSLPAFLPQQMAALQARREQERAQGLRGFSQYSQWLNDPKSRSKGLARFVSQRPYGNINVITDAHLAYIAGLREYFVVTVPQFLDTREDKEGFANFNRLFDDTQKLLSDHPGLHMDILTSGVDLAVNEAVPMTEERIRNYIERGAYFRANLNQVWLDRANLSTSRAPYANMLRDWVSHENIDMWIHNSFLHSKIWYFDRLAVSVGSFNFHHNATDHAYECTLIVQDSEFNQQIEHALALDMANSIPLLRQSSP